ncbi:hypothetical protein ACJJTC_004967 [Scirpophaga incertulas]
MCFSSDWFPGWRKHSSQPNDDGTSGQDCVEARREFPPRPSPVAPSFMWNDRGCREHNYFVCEKPSVEGRLLPFYLRFLLANLPRAAIKACYDYSLLAGTAEADLMSHCCRQ